RGAAGNESVYVTGSGDDSSLSLPAGSSATSAPMCIGALSGKMRFFTANAGAAGSRLRVQAIYGGGLGQLLGIFDVGYVSSGGDWQPSPEIRMWGGVLPLLTEWVKFRFTPAGGSVRWQIDDMYLDPPM